VRPLLKWAGGKRQLLPALEQYYPAQFRRYLEPFVGSGAVFFHLASTGVLNGRTVTLSDVNPDLIGCYRVVRDETAAVITALQALEREHRRRGDLCYYEVRDLRFNPARARLMADSAGDGSVAAARYTPELAAMLVFLNRTGFNGLFRLNRMGAFNVPAGRYRDPRICDPDHIRAVASVLRRPGVGIEHRGFEAALGDASAGDFVYCDPPYAPLSRTSSFASYTAAGFGALDQVRLQQAIVRACRRGAHVVMSNSSAPEIESAYQARAARQVKIAVHRVPARRAINSRASSRGPVDELIITNVPATLASVKPRMVKAQGPL
jgi:DNA adenine methylase